MFDQQNINARQARWFSFIREYDFEIKHINGKENSVVNALSHHANLLYASINYELYFENKTLIAGNFNNKTKKKRPWKTKGIK